MAIMKLIIDNLNEFYSGKVRLVKTLMKREHASEYPELLKWCLQMLYFDGSHWIEICRIDNYPHKKHIGSHVHYFGKDDAKRQHLSFTEAEAEIKRVSARILLERFGEIIDLGD
ncbi:MAG: hypothetical protein ABIF10_01765 [Candidatus Woesearchaeota archaeon]